MKYKMISANKAKELSQESDVVLHKYLKEINNNIINAAKEGKFSTNTRNIPNLTDNWPINYPCIFVETPEIKSFINNLKRISVILVNEGYQVNITRTEDAVNGEANIFMFLSIRWS